MGKIDLQKHFKYDEKVHQRLRSQTNLSEIARYFNSPQSKLFLSNILGQAALGEYNMNCGEIAEKISASKSGTCNIITECVAAGWVEMYKHQGKTCYKASSVMMDIYKEYYALKEKWCNEIFNIKL